MKFRRVIKDLYKNVFRIRNEKSEGDIKNGDKEDKLDFDENQSNHDIVSNRSQDMSGYSLSNNIPVLKVLDEKKWV